MDPILIIDDEKDNLEALKRLLRTEYEVTIETSPLEAMKLLAQKRYHVIISDQRMPEMTGVELLEKAKKLSPFSTRILLTGYTDVDSIIDAINRGNIYRYIAKPWDPKDLKITVKLANESFLLKKELEEKNQSLLKANEDLKLLDKAKARFLSLVSHELNTPLTVLSSFVQLLESSQNSLPKEVNKAVSSISSASNRFSEIIQEVIAFIKAESNTHLTIGKLNLKEFFSQLKNLDGKLEWTGADYFLCDPTKMSVALEKILKEINLIAKDKIKIAVSVENKKNQIEITWTGEALSQEAFQPLEVSGDILNHQKNLGLNLALAKAILDQHQATTEVEKGRFKIAFPVFA